MNFYQFFQIISQQNQVRKYYYSIIHVQFLVEVSLFRDY